MMPCHFAYLLVLLLASTWPAVANAESAHSPSPYPLEPVSWTSLLPDGGSTGDPAVAPDSERPLGHTGATEGLLLRDGNPSPSGSALRERRAPSTVGQLRHSEVEASLDSRDGLLAVSFSASSACAGGRHVFARPILHILFCLW